MKPFLRAQLQRFSKRLEILNTVLSHPNATDNMERFRALGREYSEISQLVEHFIRYQQLENDSRTAYEMLLELDIESNADSAMRTLAKDEIDSANAAMEQLEDKLQRLLLPKDPNDCRNAFIEIRAGAGGNESALFAGDLLRMYVRYAEHMGWINALVSASESELGGYREVVLRLEGEGVYGRIKFESGGHRVQRVPQTETQGRIHTSACTVAVLPEPDEASFARLNPADLRIDTYRASGAGGQHVNKTDSAVRITHLPSGIVAECQDDRSQHRNRAKALQVLAARIEEKARIEQATKEAVERKGLIGSGDRSDRIRTYNFPQGRITDHRINLTLYKLAYVLEGDLDETLNALALAHEAEQITNLEEKANTQR